MKKLHVLIATFIFIPNINTINIRKKMPSLFVIFSELPKLPKNTSNNEKPNNSNNKEQSFFSRILPKKGQEWAYIKFFGYAPPPQ